MKLSLFLLLSFVLQVSLVEASTCDTEIVDDIASIWTDAIANKQNIPYVKSKIGEYFAANSGCIDSEVLGNSLEAINDISSRLPQMVYRAYFDHNKQVYYLDAKKVCASMGDFTSDSNGHEDLHQRLCHSYYLKTTERYVRGDKVSDLMGGYHKSRLWNDIHTVKTYLKKNISKMYNSYYVSDICATVNNNSSKLINGIPKGFFTFSRAELCMKEYFKAHKAYIISNGDYKLHTPNNAHNFCKHLSEAASLSNRPERSFLPITRYNRCVYDFTTKYISLSSNRETFKRIILNGLALRPEMSQEEINHMSGLDNPSFEWTKTKTIQKIQDL